MSPLPRANALPSPSSKPPSTQPRQVVLNTAQAKKATKDILAQHCIAQDRSNDLVTTSTTGFPATAAAPAAAADEAPADSPFIEEAAAADEPAGRKSRGRG